MSVRINYSPIHKEVAMTIIRRWEPAREVMTLRDAMDQLFNDAFTSSSGVRTVASAPLVDMYQTDDDIVVKATVPGFSKDDVDITLTDDILSLRGNIEEKEDDETKSYSIREHRYASFERSLRLPVDVEIKKVEALFENGILTITLPKAEAVKPKSIMIKAK